ncbi:iron-containing alcohol dehydrogenase [Aurantimonas endophytica]|uniref:Alcohol dehydrogenase class IV n=1 Tax=Aurantimonas endophytica TaxID=1522175 RepID=A0A7W6HDY3_9HYPH|nr:iron-containing alcohol dehydrogenase [Aurantimonas endophytica]MBB4003398.1 alcohol dehydrogenase class IV [Aurantimonas endophytica]MCO6404259.1 iron-containing alcohol dehydrogenase [Aurantimonas endophytica]
MNLFGTIRAPRELVFGSGQRHSLGRMAAKLGSRALVVTDERLAGNADFRAMTAQLEGAGMVVRIDASTLPDVPVASAVASAEAARDFAPDLVIGVGGGSCLDMAKCVAVLLTHGGRPQDYYGEHLVPGPVMPLLAIPTTAGTGSEVTPVAVLSDDERTLKVGISSPYLVPTAAICDPDLTVSCPPGLTAIAGADALTHAIEAFTAIRRDPVPEIAQDRVFVGKNGFSDHFALRAIALLGEGLERACQDGGDMEAREKVMMGATLAGLAFGVAGTAAAHAIQYPVGALTHTAHGAGVACLMPYVMQWNAPAIGPELAEMASVMGLQNADAVIPAVADLFARIGIPKTLAELGLAEDRLDWVAEQSCGIARLIQNNPRPLPASDMSRLVASAFSGDRTALT